MCSRNLAISVALILALVPLINSLPQHSLAKRSTFFEIECKGVFNKSIFYRLDRICEDCYSLFREPELHTLCKKDCFGTDYFSSCVEALLLAEEMDKFDRYRLMLGKRNDSN
ncbi:ion transport peptide isoform X2 [Sitodiplosis mosellana]|uniref:ion transport peptide isoform X2 n=1 Tax=Sitodiplosis mosellana TaxID=263140 RepID=UPI002445248C|nr:ion transport peptide isoform X2 [Sitodiplosis mosellana]